MRRLLPLIEEAILRAGRPAAVLFDVFTWSGVAPGWLDDWAFAWSPKTGSLTLRS